MWGNCLRLESKRTVSRCERLRGGYRNAILAEQVYAGPLMYWNREEVIDAPSFPGDTVVNGWGAPPGRCLSGIFPVQMMIS
jgi:hypothetical protein